MKTRTIKVKRTWKERWQERKKYSFWQRHKLIEIPDFEAPYKLEPLSSYIGNNDVYRGPDRASPSISPMPHPYPQRRSVDEMYPPITRYPSQPLVEVPLTVHAPAPRQPSFMENVASTAVGNVVGNGISHALFDHKSEGHSEKHVEASTSPREVTINNYYGSEPARAPEPSYEATKANFDNDYDRTFKTEAPVRESSSWGSSNSWGNDEPSSPSSSWSDSSSWGSSSNSDSSSSSSWDSSSSSSWDSGSSSSDSSWD